MKCAEYISFHGPFARFRNRTLVERVTTAFRGRFSSRFAAVFVLAAACPASATGQVPIEPVRGIDLRMSEGVEPVTPAVAEPAFASKERGVGEPPARLDRRVRLRGLAFELTATTSYDDNIFRADTGQQSSFVLTLKPAVTLRGMYRKHSVQMGYEGEWGRVVRFSGQDYLDHRLFAATKLDLTRELNVDLKIDRDVGHDSPGDFGHDPRDAVGFGLSLVGRSVEPEPWTDTTLSGKAAYGRRIAKIQLVGGVAYSQLRYRSDSQSFRDLDDLVLTGQAFWNIGPRFSPFLKVSRTFTDYLSPDSFAGTAAPDSTAAAYLLGLRWEATAKTSGTVQWGLDTTDLDQPGGDGSAQFNWDADLVWEPKPFSKVRINASGRAQEIGRLDAGGSVFDSTRFGIGWSHGFTERLTFATDASWDFAELSGGSGGGFSIDESIFLYRGALDYQLKDWLQVGVGFARASREEDSGPGPNAAVGSRAFTNNVYFLRLATSFDRVFAR